MGLTGLTGKVAVVARWRDRHRRGDRRARAGCRRLSCRAR